MSQRDYYIYGMVKMYGDIRGNCHSMSCVVLETFPEHIHDEGCSSHVISEIKTSWNSCESEPLPAVMLQSDQTHTQAKIQVEMFMHV